MTARQASNQLPITDTQKQKQGEEQVIVNIRRTRGFVMSERALRRRAVIANTLRFAFGIAFTALGIASVWWIVKFGQILMAASVAS